MKIAIIYFTVQVLLILAVVSTARADSTQEDALHLAAHAGTTYAITHLTEVGCKKMLGADKKLVCTLVGVGLANAANVGYKASQSFPNDTKRAVVGGIIGSGVAGLAISLDF